MAFGQDASRDRLIASCLCPLTAAMAWARRCQQPPTAQREARTAYCPNDLIAFKIASGVQGDSNPGCPPGFTAWTASRIAQ